MRVLYRLALAFLIIGLSASEYKLELQRRAEQKFPEFYSALVNGDTEDARTRITESAGLIPEDARYAAWAAYVHGQAVPPEIASCSRESQPLTPAQREAAERAIAAYQRAVQLNPADAQFRHNLAWLFYRTGQEQRAVAEFEAAIRLDEPNPILHASFGMLLEETQRLERADEEYERAIALSPQLIDSRFFEDLQQRSPGRSSAILRSAASALTRSSGPIIEAKLGRIYAELGDKKQATSMIEDALQRLPNLSLSWANLGNLQAASGDIEAAFASYKKAISLDPGLIMPHLRMANLYRVTGKSQLAMREYQMTARNADAKLPPSVAHDSRLYRGSRQPIDSQLPPVLFRYMSSCDGARAYQSMAELSPRSRELKYFKTRAADCEYVQSPYRFCSSSQTPSSKQEKD